MRACGMQMSYLCVPEWALCLPCGVWPGGVCKQHPKKALYLKAEPAAAYLMSETKQFW